MVKALRYKIDSLTFLIVRNTQLEPVSYWTYLLFLSYLTEIKKIEENRFLQQNREP